MSAAAFEFETECNANLIETWRVRVPDAPLPDQDAFEDRLREELSRGAGELIGERIDWRGERTVSPQSVAGFVSLEATYTIFGVYPDLGAPAWARPRRFARTYRCWGSAADAEALALQDCPDLTIAAVIFGDVKGLADD